MLTYDACASEHIYFEFSDYQTTIQTAYMVRRPQDQIGDSDITSLSLNLTHPLSLMQWLLFRSMPGHFGEHFNEKCC